MKLRNKKTGDVFNFTIKATQDNTACYFILKTGSGGWEDGLTYGTLEEINEDWEDYKPAEPLVEGRSQRAVLRAAARLSGMNVATVKRSDIAEIVIFDFGSQCRVELRDRGIKVKNRGVYAIAELCGEVEE